MADGAAAAQQTTIQLATHSGAIPAARTIASSNLQHMASVGRMEKVLCVCVGNISRSPIMHAVLQQHLGAGFRVESAGISKEMAGRPANLAPSRA